MKKTFKKSIACLLAVLMVVFSVPFTAMAADPGPVDGYFYGPSPYGSNDCVIWWDEENPPTSEPDYIGYNDPEVSDLGAWGLSFGATIDTTQAAGGDQKEDLMDEYRPIVALTASAYNSANSTTTYGLSNQVAYSDADILDASDIKAGQKFVLTFEFGGFDALTTCQMKGEFDSSKIQMSYWGGRGGATYTKAPAGSLDAIVARGQDFYVKAGASTGTTCSVADSNFYGVFTANDPNKSAFVGERPYGEYGLIIFSIAFEALEDCDLRDVITLGLGEDGCVVNTYNPNLQVAYTRPELGNRCNIAFYDPERPIKNATTYTYLAPTIWSGVTGGSEPVEHVHDFTGAVAVSNGDGTHTFTCTAEGCDQSEGYQKTVECTKFTSEETTPPSCTEAGVTTWTCEECGYQYTTDEPGATGHTADYADVQYNWTGSDEEGYTACEAVIGCAKCDDTYGTVSAKVTSVSDGGSCTVPGKVTYTATFDDENLKTQVKEVPGVLAPHTYDYENATYNWADDFSTCSAIATCTACGEAEDTATAKEITSKVTTEPGFDKEGTRTYTAVFDEPFKNATKTETIPAIPYYTITVTAENGTATANGEASAKVAVNGDVTLAAAPATEGLEFVGWSLNDKIVSTDETYTTKAIANADYVAIYAEAEEASEFTVVFVDQYGSVYSTQTVTSGEQVVPPADPSLVGFTFKGWSLTDEEIDALTSNTTIYANFERTVADDKFDVTVTGDCTIEGTEEKTLAVDYNTKVTVNAPKGAVNGTWKVDDAIVAYGTSYTFFVGSDITLTYEEDAAVTAEPTVAAVSVTKDASSYRVSFLATRSLADGYAYVNAGFVFGKNLEDADLNLDKVGETGTGTDSGVVKALYCSTDSEQFSLSYGISAATGTASARAFLAYVDTNGETQIIYGDIQSYRY